MKKYLLLFLLFLSALSSAQPWTRNTFPGQKNYEEGFPEGRGWDHVQVICDIKVSPLDSNFIAAIDNVNAAVFTEDGMNFRPLSMPHLNTQGSRGRSLEFSRYDKDTYYVLISANKKFYGRMNHSHNPDGIWKTTDRGQTWTQIFKPPQGHYAHMGNFSSKSVIAEDPCPARSRYIYHGTSTQGIIVSKDYGVNWESLIPEDNPDFEEAYDFFDRRRIKSLYAAEMDGNRTVIFSIAEKRMPLDKGDQSFYGYLARPPQPSAEWNFENKLDNSVDKSLPLILESGIEQYSRFSAHKKYAAVFDGETSYSIPISYNNKVLQNFSLTFSVKTEVDDNMVVVSFDKNEYFEVGIDAGLVRLSLAGAAAADIYEDFYSQTKVNDGEWHHVAISFRNRKLLMHVDGQTEISHSSEWGLVGKGNTRRFGYMGVDSKASTQGGVRGDKFFKGQLDKVYFYKTKGISQDDLYETYLYVAKHPVTNGSFWRFEIGSDGELEKAVRLHGKASDFGDLAIDPGDPSKGWIIRKTIADFRPGGGREVYRFSDWGETLSLNRSESQIPVGTNSYMNVWINPSNKDHLYVWCDGQLKNGYTYSTDGGRTWHGTDRTVVDGHVPSIRSDIPHNFHLYDQGGAIPGDFKNTAGGNNATFLTQGSNTLLMFNATKGFFRSTDYGANFKTYFTGGPNKEASQLAIAPSNPDYISVGMLEAGQINTRNGGKYWESHNRHSDSVFHRLFLEHNEAGVHWGASLITYGQAYHPTKENILLSVYGKFGVIIRSEDGGAIWLITPYRTHEQSNVFWSATDTSVVYAGQLKSTDGGRTFPFNLEKSVIAMSASDGNIIVGISERAEVDDQSLLLHISVNGGQDWIAVPDPPKEKVPGTSKYWHVVATRRYPSRRPSGLIAIDPSPEYNPNIDSENRVRIMMAGRSGIYEYNASMANGSGSTDDWILRNSGLSDSPHFNLIDPVPWMGFVAIDPRPGFEHMAYAAKTNDRLTVGKWNSSENKNHGYPGGQIEDIYYVSYNGGRTWKGLYGENFPDAPVGAAVNDLVVDQNGRLVSNSAQGIFSIKLNLPNENEAP